MRNLVTNEQTLSDLEKYTLNRKESQNLTGKPSIDRPSLKFFQDVDIPVSQIENPQIPKMSIYQMASEANKNNGKNVALDVRVSKNGFKKGIKITYDSFFKNTNVNAKASSVLGIEEDDIVPIILPNVAEARTLIYSNSIIGAASCPVSPLLPDSQLAQLISENDIKNLFIFSAFYEKYERVLKESRLENIVYLDGTESLPKGLKLLKKAQDIITHKQPVLPKDRRIIPWDEYQKYSKEIKEDIKPVYRENHIAAYVGTSGTTGSSKWAGFTDENINAAALQYIDGKVFEGNFLDALLPSIGYGISMLHYQTVSGRYVYLIPELLTDKTAQAFSVLKPDNFPGGPVHYINLKASEEFKEGNIPKRKNYISGGASLAADVESALNGVDQDYQEDGINEDIVVRQGYGLTENVATGTYSKRGSYRFGSIGIPMIYNTISIFKPGTDEELSYNEEGEICITGPCVMQGYLNNEEETKKVIVKHSDGKDWVHTKDLGYMDEDGRVFLTERMKNIFMRTGFNVHPAKIAEFINTIPTVRNAAVIGFEHPKEQAVPVAFVEFEPQALSEKSKSELLEEVNSLCYSHLEETSVPYDYVSVDTLPINAGGKIDIREISKQAEIDFNKNTHVLKKELTFIKK